MKYSMEQKIALVKKLELYRLEKNLSYMQLAKVIGTDKANLHNWEKLGNLPTGKFCYQIELITTNWEPTLYKERLSADYIQECVNAYKKHVAEVDYKNKQAKAEKKITSGNI